MQLSSQQSLPVSQALAWAALNDTALLQAAIPGCESLTQSADSTPEAPAFDAALSVAIGPVKAKFKGKLRLSDLQPPKAYSLQFEGQGGPAGHGKGTAQVRLEAVSAHETLLHYEVQASVGGKIAQIGSRLVDMAAQKMASDFFEAFNTALQARHGVAPVAEPAVEAVAPTSLWARLRAWWARLLGGKT